MLKGNKISASHAITSSAAKNSRYNYLEGNKERGSRCVTYQKILTKKKGKTDVLKGMRELER